MTIAEYAALPPVLSWSQRLRWRRSIAGLRTSPGRQLRPKICPEGHFRLHPIKPMVSGLVAGVE
jgi:hypothetical protein